MTPILNPIKHQNSWHDRQLALQGSLQPKAGDIYFAYGLEKPGFPKAALLEPMIDAVLGPRCTSKMYPMIFHKPSKVIMLARPDTGKRVIGIGVTLKTVDGLPSILNLYGGPGEASFCRLRILPYTEKPMTIDWHGPKFAWMVMSKWIMPGDSFAELTLKR